MGAKIRESGQLVTFLLVGLPVGSLCHTLGVVRLPSCVICVHHYHVPGLCLLGIGGAPYISYKNMALL